MLQIGNLKKAEEILRNYLYKGDFSKPMVLAGWDEMGKRVFINKIAKGIDKEVFLLNYTLIDTKDISKISDDIIQEYSVKREIPVVILIDIMTDGFLRKVLQNNIDILLIRTNLQEFKTWVDIENSSLQLDPMTIVYEEEFLKQEERKNKKKEEIIQDIRLKLSATFLDIEKEPFLEYFNEEIKKLYTAEFALFISKEDIKDDWEYVTEVVEDGVNEIEKYLKSDIFANLIYPDLSQEEELETKKTYKEQEEKNREKIKKDKEALLETFNKYKSLVEKSFF